MKRILMILLGISYIVYSCEKKEGHSVIIMKNNTNDSIVCQMIWSENSRDTLFSCRRSGRGICPYSQIEIEVSESKTWRENSWERDFNVISSIQFLIVNDSIYSNVSCDSIRQYNMVLHRYQLTLEDLQRMNWVVEYPTK